MNRLRRWSALAGLVLVTGLFPALRGQAPPPAEKKGEEKPAEKWLFDRTLAVSPAAAPVPALKYRLYPPITERKDGNAVPIYLRFAHERSDARKKELREKPEEWNKLPLEKLPLAEVKQFLDEHRLKYNMRQLELGARRKTADWNYTLDAGDLIGLLLPDMQEMRMQAPLLVLKARVEMVEGHYADAIRTLETGFSFSQHINEGPFLIGSLIGIAVANQMADCALEMVERPGATNLYWALTVLPRPLIDLRRPLENEFALLEMQFPDMADLDRSRTPEQWNAVLFRVRKEIERLSRIEEGNPPGVKAPKAGTGSADPADKSPDLEAARKYLTEVAGMSAAHVEAMPPAQVLVLYLSNFYHEQRDAFFKASYLPFPQGRPLDQAADERLKSLPNTEPARVARLFLPALLRVRLAELRLARKLEALRAIEALRMHAVQARQLPDRLDQVTVVPVPNDPGTGKAFGYQRDGQTATLTSRIPGEPLETTGLRYRVTLRK
ncbi:MAG TPA: hypothetical protein VKA46_19235 [Gemmataceae bacterium]|nr:hypothetical protein [Gemmataceae bacterium]